MNSIGDRRDAFLPLRFDFKKRWRDSHKLPPKKPSVRKEQWHLSNESPWRIADSLQLSGSRSLWGAGQRLLVTPRFVCTSGQLLCRTLPHWLCVVMLHFGELWLSSMYDLKPVPGRFLDPTFSTARRHPQDWARLHLESNAVRQGETTATVSSPKPSLSVPGSRKGHTFSVMVSPKILRQLEVGWRNAMWGVEGLLKQLTGKKERLDNSCTLSVFRDFL